MPQFIRAIYEDGVLKPAGRVKLKERAWCLISLYPEAEWKEEFNTLLRRIHTRTKRYPPIEIERLQTPRPPLSFRTSEKLGERMNRYRL